MKTPFSELLTGLRKEAGFETAYRFYHDNGGAKVLGFSYRKYLLFEQGAALPAAEVLNRLSPALGLIPRSPGAGRFGAAWLRTLAGEEAYKASFEAFFTGKTEAPGLSPMHKAMEKVLTRRPLSVEQALLILSTYEHYLAFMLLMNDAAPWDGERLAGTAALEKNKAAAILTDFSRAGLLKRQAKGVYLSEADAVMVEFPRPEMLPQKFNQLTLDYQARLAASGRNVWRRVIFLRADAAELEALYPVMSLNISTAGAYATEEGGKNTAMFVVEGRVARLFDF